MNHTHMQIDTNIYNIYIYIYTHKNYLLKKITSKFQTTHTHTHTNNLKTHTHTHREEKITVTENQKPPEHIHTHIGRRQKHINYQRPIRGKTDYGKHTLRKREEGLYINP